MPRVNGTVTPAYAGNATPYAAAALRSECDHMASVPEGTRNAELNKSAFRMGRHVGAGNIAADVVRDALTIAARVTGLPEHEIETILRDDPNGAINRGAAVPRYVEPAYRAAVGPAVTVLTERLAAGVSDAMAPAADIAAMFPLLDWRALWETEDEEEWIVEPILPARRSVALFSAPKVGKSLLMLELAVGIARGTMVLGVIPDRPRKVLYVDFENDPRGDVRTRLQAMDLKPEQLDNLCYLSFPAIAKLDTEMGGYQLVETAQFYGCEVVVIDTVSRAVAGEENANDTWLGFYRNTGMKLKALGIACVRLDHSGKDRDKGMRGGSAKYGDVDAVWKLETISEDTLSLECTDHRMPIPTTFLTITRQAFPLRHHVVGTHWSDRLDHAALRVDQILTELGVHTQTSVRDCGQALREAGEGVRNEVLTRAVKARKLRMDDTSKGGEIG